MKNIESENLIEEAFEIFEQCMKCGLCKSSCPVFKVLKEEYSSPRGFALIAKNKILDKIVFKCTLCKACEKNCPLDIKLVDGIMKIRQALAVKQQNTKVNKEMLNNIKKTGNPFGKNPDKNKRLYCC